jgi:RNA polymerase sigma factor (sigma-70 family)
MTTRGVGIGRPGLRALVARHGDPGESDGDLLRRFARDRDEAAFEAVVARHAGLVHAAARRVLGNTHDAEDVGQAAFLLLAKKAGSRSWQTTVAPWLYKTAYLLALKARTAAARRARREGTAARPATHPLAEMSGQDLLAVLDAELLALPESLRAPLVLCYLQGATRDEAAERLGCPLGTLKKRLERGRDRLHTALVRRGLSLPAALLGTLLVGPAVAVPPAFLTTTTQAAVAFAAGGPPPVGLSADVRRLLTGGTMTVPKIKAALTAVLGLGLLAAAIAGTPGSDEKAPPKAAVVEKKPESPAAAGSMRVVVRGPDDKPVAGVAVYVSIVTTDNNINGQRDHETDAAGATVIALPKNYATVRMWVSKKGFAGLFAGWEERELAEGKRLPAEYTVHLEPATTAGGRVVDPDGKPIAGAALKVELTDVGPPAKGDGRLRFNPTLAWGSAVAKTDVNGRWRLDNVPNRQDVQFRLFVTHPDYLSDEVWDETAKASGVTATGLRAATATLTLKPGVVVTGTVVDQTGKPVVGAVVIHGWQHYAMTRSVKYVTDADGRYRLPALPAAPTLLTVLSKGWAPQMRTVELKPGLPAQDFRLAAGQPVRLRVVDPGGNPVPSPTITLKEWQGSRAIYSAHDPNHPPVPPTGPSRTTDADGYWRWADAPAEPVKVWIGARGFAAQDLEVVGGKTDQTVTLKPEHRVRGSVTDAVTGKPIAAFTVIPVDVFRGGDLYAERYNSVAEKAGRLDFLVTRTDIPVRLRVEAAGYRTQTGREFRAGDDAARTQDFNLQPSPARTGLVVDGNGKPVAGAKVALATPTQAVRPSDDSHNQRAVTDAAGRFTFPDPGEPWAVVAQTASGVATASFPADAADAGTLKLQPWATVRGRFEHGGKPVAGARVFLNPVRLGRPDRPKLDDGQQVLTGPDGRFEFPHVAPGPVQVHVGLGPWSDPGYSSAPSVPLDLKPGDRPDLVLGAGATVTGRVKLTGKVPADLDCTYSINYLVRREPGIAPPADVAAAGFDIRKGWKDRWAHTDAGQAYLKTLHTWFVKLPADGSFRVGGVPAGEYDLAVAVYAKPTGCLVDPLARRVVRVTVTKEDAARGEVTVPDVEAEVVPVPAVGDTPALSFRRPDGTAGTLADVRGKYAVVHFWASWCEPCKKQLPALKELHERSAAGGLTTLSLSLDDDAATWQGAVKALAPPWPQGRLTADGTGVSSVPTYWLLDPTGKLVAKAYDPDELAAAVRAAVK